MRSTVLFSLPLAALAIPSPAIPANDVKKRAEDFNPFLIEDGCRGKMYNDNKVDGYNKLLEAVFKAHDMAAVAVKEWWDEGKHGEVAALYLAIPDNGTYKDNEHAQRAHANLQGVALLDARNPFLSKKVVVHCTDISNKCGRNVEGTNKPIAGYAENGGNVVTGYTYDVAFCEPWFLSQTPDEAFQAWDGQPQDQISMDYLENDAGKMLHEMMHINMITRDRPHIIDVKWNDRRAYTAPYIADWVRSGASTEEVVNNADSYTQFVNAIHFKNKFGFLPPPKRVIPVTENNNCYGDKAEYVDSAQDKHIADFCQKAANDYKPSQRGEIEYEYDVGTADHVRFRLSHRKRGHLGSATVQDQCLSTMPKIFHGCNTNTKWKSGGEYTFNEKETLLYKYTVEPVRKRISPIPDKTIAKCDVWYKFWYNEFYISGGLWAGNDFGQSQLLGNLRRCGVVSEWRFDYKPEIGTDNIEWDAYGRIPIGAHMWGCVRQAMVDAGAPGELGCGGR